MTADVAAEIADVAERFSWEPQRDYVWPEATEDQKERSHPGGDAACRVMKVTYANPKKRFWNSDKGKTVHIGQWRVPMADSKFDHDRLFLELRRNGLILLTEAFDDAPHFCQLNDCWRPEREGEGYCSNLHRDLALNAHDRHIKFD